MKNKLLNFIQYHNAVVIILIGTVLALSGYVFAQTDTGQEIIGQAQEKVLSVDNQELLNVDLSNFDMNFKILEINQDNATSTESNYYIKYSYRDLLVIENTWQWQDKEKTMELSEKGVGNRDLGEYVAEELSEIAYWRQKELQEKQEKARQTGPTEKVVVTEYSGLIGKILDVKNAVFPGYEPIVRVAQIAPIIENNQISNNQDTNNDQLPITNNQINSNDQIIEPEPVGAGLVPAQGQPQGLPLQEPPAPGPIIDNATTTE